MDRQADFKTIFFLFIFTNKHIHINNLHKSFVLFFFFEFLCFFLLLSCWDRRDRIVVYLYTVCLSACVYRTHLHLLSIIRWPDTCHSSLICGGGHVVCPCLSRPNWSIVVRRSAGLLFQLKWIFTFALRLTPFWGTHSIEVVIGRLKTKLYLIKM